MGVRIEALCCSRLFSRIDIRENSFGESFPRKSISGIRPGSNTADSLHEEALGKGKSSAQRATFWFLVVGVSPRLSCQPCQRCQRCQHVSTVLPFAFLGGIVCGS